MNLKSNFKNIYLIRKILNESIFLSIVNILILIGITNSNLFSTRYFVQIHTIKQTDINDFEKYITNLKKIGFSGIFLRLFQNKTDSYHYILPIKNKTGVYFKNNGNLPIVYPLLDNLKSPLPVYGWMCSRWMDWVKSHKYGKYLILQNKENFKLITDTYKILSKKNIQGVLIQDDLIIKKKEETISRIKNKKKIILKYLKTIKQFFPKREVITNIYYEVPINRKIGDSWYGQNIKDYFSSGVDNIAIMLYHRQIKNELKLSKTKLYKYLKKEILNLKPYADKTYIKIQIIDFKTGKFIGISELKQILDLIPANFKGVIFTPVRSDKFTYLYLKSLINNIKKHNN